MNDNEEKTSSVTHGKKLSLLSEPTKFRDQEFLIESWICRKRSLIHTRFTRHGAWKSKPWNFKNFDSRDTTIAIKIIMKIVKRIFPARFSQFRELWHNDQCIRILSKADRSKMKRQTLTRSKDSVVIEEKRSRKVLPAWSDPEVACTLQRKLKTTKLVPDK